MQSTIEHLQNLGKVRVLRGALNITLISMKIQFMQYVLNCVCDIFIILSVLRGFYEYRPISMPDTELLTKRLNKNYIVLEPETLVIPSQILYHVQYKDIELLEITKKIVFLICCPENVERQACFSFVLTKQGHQKHKKQKYMKLCNHFNSNQM